MVIHRNKRKDKFVRVTFVFLSLFIISLGLTHFFAGDIHYSNWWGGLVFAPFTIFVGIFLLCLVVFKWEKINNLSKNKKKKT